MKEQTIKLRIKEKDLNAFDKYLTCVALCPKHKETLFKKFKYVDDVECYYLKCEECAKVKHAWFKPAWKICCDLFEAYYDKEQNQKKKQQNEWRKLGDKK